MAYCKIPQITTFPLLFVFTTSVAVVLSCHLTSLFPLMSGSPQTSISWFMEYPTISWLTSASSIWAIEESSGIFFVLFGETNIYRAIAIHNAITMPTTVKSLFFFHAFISSCPFTYITVKIKNGDRLFWNYFSYPVNGLSLSCATFLWYNL